MAHVTVPINKPRNPPIKKRAMQAIGRNMGPPASPVATQTQIKTIGSANPPINVPARPNIHHLPFRCFGNPDELIDD
jgi:hypothetical protein